MADQQPAEVSPAHNIMAKMNEIALLHAKIVVSIKKCVGVRRIIHCEMLIRERRKEC